MFALWLSPSLRLCVGRELFRLALCPIEVFVTGRFLPVDSDGEDQISLTVV